MPGATVALTAYASRADRDRALAAGFREHLAKPVNPDVLLQTLEDLLAEDAARPLTARLRLRLRPPPLIISFVPDHPQSAIAAQTVEVSCMITTGFSEAIADRIAAEHALLAARWFARLRDLLPVGANEVFPSDSLLDHIPSLIVDISALSARRPRTKRLPPIRLSSKRPASSARLRHQQRASLHQVLREYQLLGGILLRFVEDESIRLMLTPPPANASRWSRASIMRSAC